MWIKERHSMKKLRLQDRFKLKRKNLHLWINGAEHKVNLSLYIQNDYGFLYVLKTKIL